VVVVLRGGFWALPKAARPAAEPGSASSQADLLLLGLLHLGQVLSWDLLRSSGAGSGLVPAAALEAVWLGRERGKDGRSGSEERQAQHGL